ncbi:MULTISPECIES: lipopolysaccharide biosynthesis protein [unclassified Polaribacter]|jgi:O-antigen/teichoic acid export membrane protein|uniref:lipopolysaccharide biosynthesis protein n=1 Tax=unclassified Polaribacter TaxID=196858 RepID=UPI00052DA4B1|nr:MULTISPECIES: oligosaccharide flippase family protein [unclassified Polaribacter]KGL59768.1 polysaccharide biosynthesis protein [Polaribacter sp. Hel1_33_49]PKV64264.1 O-antigen/teichoic acid export membrane protein [Polaribacter sp. Hel1_33_96]
MKMLKKIAREDNFLSLTGNLVIAVLGIAGFALLARSLSLDVFGEWVLFITGGSFVEMFRFGITNTGLIRFLSGADEASRTKLIGSNALIGLGSTVLIAIILVFCYNFFNNTISNSGYNLFFKWYPLLAFLNLPWNNALVVLQADRKYGKILAIKSIKSGLFFLIILVHFFFLEMTLTQLVIGLLIVNAITSLVTIILGWDGTKYITKASVETNKTLLNFGKYTTFTLIGTNLLRSADTVIISLSPMGSAAVALYSIPLKLTELQQIPLRSFVATAFPKMSKASVQGKVEEVRDLFYTYSGALTYLFVFMSLFTFVFAEFLVLILSGEQYLQVDPITGFNVVDIVRVFSIYGLLLPIDRMTGIGLDSINKPNINAIKVFIMVVANVIGDFIAIFIFKSLILVAVASILFTLIGIWMGMYFLNKELTLSYKEIFSSGINFYKTIFNKVTHNRFSKSYK